MQIDRARLEISRLENRRVLSKASNYYADVVLGFHNGYLQLIVDPDSLIEEYRDDLLDEEGDLDLEKAQEYYDDDNICLDYEKMKELAHLLEDMLPTRIPNGGSYENQAYPRRAAAIR